MAQGTKPNQASSPTDLAVLPMLTVSDRPPLTIAALAS